MVYFLNMKIIGITGAIGHGKSTLSNFLQQQDDNITVLETSSVIAEVANQLNSTLPEFIDPTDITAINKWLSEMPNILAGVAGKTIDPGLFIISYELINSNPTDFSKLISYINQLNDNPAMARQEINTDNKQQYRSILQWIGGYCATKLPGNIWYEELIRRANFAIKNGAKLVIIGGVRFISDADVIHSNGGIVVRITRPTDVTDSSDPTEHESQTIKADTAVVNDGSLENLKIKATKLYQDILNDKIEKQY